jgi:glycosyltransferase involved in cell wall biosynthesis
VGSITKPRGVLDYIKAMEKIPEPYRLILIGHFIPAHLLEECKELPGWNRVDYLGFKTLDELSQLLGSAKIGLSVLHAEKNYLQSLPTKGFEYMAAGLPLIMSDFEYWKPYFEGCAIHIEPAQSDLIASAIMELINDSSKYSSLATEASLKCVHYSWEGQFKLLHQFYQEILTS